MLVADHGLGLSRFPIQSLTMLQCRDPNNNANILPRDHRHFCSPSLAQPGPAHPAEQDTSLLYVQASLEVDKGTQYAFCPRDT
jgi:hypothetical protein